MPLVATYEAESLARPDTYCNVWDKVSS